jgi:hypothetical protein
MSIMRRSVVWLAIGAPLALVAVGAGAAAAVPTIRHIVTGLWNAPDRLPALPNNSQVHYQQGADDYARVVSAMLPSAIARIEAVHGRPFAHPVPVGVYATPEAYAVANGLGSARPVGVTFFGRVNLSPDLYARQRQRLCAILTHELSHAHIQGWISANAYIHLPNWFKEGLAVMVSEGGGAEFVSEQEARAAIQRGEHITVDDSGSLRTLVEVRFERPPPRATPSHLILLAYRQAGMFVAYLHDSDRAAFARMMNAILDGCSFVEAVTIGYRGDVQSLWQKFAQTSAERK